MKESEIQIGKQFKPLESKETVVEVVHKSEKSVLFKIVKSPDESEVGNEESCSIEEFINEAYPYIEVDEKQIVMELDIDDDVITYESSEGFLALAVKGTEAEERCEKSPEYTKRKLI